MQSGLEQKMIFHVGDQVIHWSHGPGEIIQLDEKELSGHTSQYYVVKLRDMMLWVPVEETEHCLRLPTPANDFPKLFQILACPGEPLSADRLERKTQLTDQMKDGTLESVCLVVRDLTFHKRVKKMNDYDNAILERATDLLLHEWSVALSVSLQQADRKLKELLGEENGSS